MVIRTVNWWLCKMATGDTWEEVDGGFWRLSAWDLLWSGCVSLGFFASLMG